MTQLTFEEICRQAEGLNPNELAALQAWVSQLHDGSKRLHVEVKHIWKTRGRYAAVGHYHMEHGHMKNEPTMAQSLKFVEQLCTDIEPSQQVKMSPDTKKIIEFNAAELYPNDGEKLILTEGNITEKSKALFDSMLNKFMMSRAEFKRNQNREKQ